MNSSNGAAARGRKVVIAACGLAVIVGGGVFYWMRQTTDKAQAARVQAARNVPVSVAAAERRDVPVYLTGLGTVQASFTVGIRAQVDGKLEEVLFVEGQEVKQGDVLAKIDPRLYQAAYNQARAKKAQDDANLVALEKDLVRFKTLASKGFQSDQNIDLQQAKVDTTKASIAADIAAIESARTQLDYTTITAPSDGRMGVRLVDPGNIVHANDQTSIAVLTRTRPIFVVFTLPAQTLDDVRGAYAKGDVQVIAYDRDNKQPLSTGTLQTIDNLIDPATASYKLKATFANDDDRLWPGEFVNARILVGTRPNAVVIPNAAVQRGPDGLFAWVITPNNTAEPRPIQVAPGTGDVTVVTEGVADGERVVIAGQYKLQTKSPVNIVPAQTGGGAGAS